MGEVQKQLGDGDFVKEYFLDDSRISLLRKKVLSKAPGSVCLGPILDLFFLCPLFRVVVGAILTLLCGQLGHAIRCCRNQGSVIGRQLLMVNDDLLYIGAC